MYLGQDLSDTRYTNKVDKPKVRQEYLLKRRQISTSDAFTKSELIRQKLQASINWQSILSVHIYDSQVVLNEVDTSRIIEYIRINLPQIDITIGEASPTTPLPTAKYDLILVPVVAFDAQRNRLGFGGGWYDRFLATQPQAMTTGLAYDFQRVAVIAVEAHDVRLNRVITDRGVL